MGEMAKFPYLTGRKGSCNLYYKREVPPELRADGRPSQVWRSLGTSDRKKAEGAYGAKHTEVEALFARWRQDDAQPIGPVPPPALSESAPTIIPLTPALLRRLADAHYLNVYEDDFQWRGDLWKKVHEDEDAFWRGDVIKLPEDDWVEFKGTPHSYFAYLIEEPVIEDVFLYSIFRARKAKLRGLQRRYQLGDNGDHGPIANGLLRTKEISLSDADRRRLMRKLMEVEIKALEDLTAGNEASFDGIVDRQAPVELPIPSAPAAKPGELMSYLIDKYLDDTSREREWPTKTVRRKRGELSEFLEIAGDKPVNAYRQTDGVIFKDVQLALPVYRQKPPFKGLALADAAKKTSELRMGGAKVDLLNPITINDKIGTASLFFEWAKSRDSSVVNPLVSLRIQRSKNKRKGKKRHPWTIDELNRMFAAPIYTGCQSEHRWKQPGDLVLRRSAMYWVPLIALFSGMRLGEIIQMQVSDVRRLDGIEYFDVTPVAIDLSDDEAVECDDEEEKSLKTAASRRGAPIHKTLFDLGFGHFLEFRRGSGERRLCPEYDKAKDDDSWSKQFSKHFKRFRDSIDVTRRGVKFHSLRHNVEDALRNADVRKEVRDAIQGHGENGVSREYGSGYYVKTLNEAIQKIEYTGLKLPRLGG
jgi:integrase